MESQTTEHLEKNKTPNEELAALISEQLLKEDLISESKLQEVQRKMAAGTAKQEDWRLWIEMALEEKDRKEVEDV